MGDDLLEVTCGPRHCGWHPALIASSITWDRLDAPVSGPEAYIRDPSSVGLDGDAVTGTFDSDAILPDDAIDARLTSGDVELWAAPRGDAIFLVAPDRVERWPQMRVACA